MLLRMAPTFALFILVGPILFGLWGTIEPAFGHFPALGANDFSLEPFHKLFERPGLGTSILLSLWTGVGTTLIALSVVALFVAGWSNTKWFTTIQHLVSPLLSVPHAAAAFGLAFLISPSGWLFRLVSPELTGITRPPNLLILNDPYALSMMAGLIIKEIPFLLLIVLSALPQTNARRVSQVAVSLGYGRVFGFLFTVWPSIYKQIRLAVFAVIAYASSVVDVAIILGPTNPAPLSPRIVSWISDPDLLVRFEASAGALLQLGVTILALLMWWLIEKLSGAVMRRLAMHGARYQKDIILRVTGLSVIVTAAIAIFMGLFILGIWSIAGFWSFPNALPSDFSLDTWRQSWFGLQTPFLYTIGVGVFSTLAAIIITLACLEREARTGNTGGSRALLFLYLPLIVPQVGFVFGIQNFFLNFDLDGRFASLIFVHLIFVLPYVFLSLSDPWRAWDTRFSYAGLSLGASPNAVFWKIRFPMLLRAIFVACAVGFAVSIGQYLTTLLIGAGRIPTITTEAVALASGGDRRVIGVYAFIQMLLPFLGFALAAIIPATLFKNKRDMRATS
ncbi:MAG: ABC transporter permease [Nitratireductor sp.]